MQTKTSDQSGYISLLFGDKALILWAMFLGIGLHALNWYIIATITPSMVTELGGVSLISWVTTIYLAMSILFGAYGGYLKRQIGIRGATILSSCIFLLGSIWVALSPTMEMVVIGRALQGIGEGMIMAISYGCVHEFFEESQIPKIFGLFGISYVSSAAIGPIFAGMLTEFFSWRAVFAVNIVLVAIYLGLVFSSAMNKKHEIQNDNQDKPKHKPIGRLLFVGLGITAVGMTGGIEDGLSSLSLIAGAMILLFIAIRLDRTKSNKLFPTNLFQLSTVSGSGFCLMFLLLLPNSSVHVFIPLLAQRLHDLSIANAGYLGSFISFGWSLVSLLVGLRDRQNSANLFILAGITGHFLGFSLLLASLFYNYLALIIMGLIFIGCGMGACWAFVNQRTISNTDRGEKDLVASLIPAIQSTSYAIGAAAAGAGANLGGLSTQPLQDALSPVFFMNASISALALICGIWLIKRKTTS